MKKIHPTAIISPDVIIEDRVEIGPYSVIEGNVKIGKNCSIGPHVQISGWTEIGDNCKIFKGAVIGSIPQDLKYKGEKTFLKIGNSNTIREFVTINPGTSKDDWTIIGNNNLLMAYSHIAHNCILGDNIIISNAGTLAGHVKVDDYAVIGGMVGVHQFCRIGKHSIIGGCSKITKDILPFIMADGHPAIPHGINIVGLKRRNFDNETIATIESAYKIIFRSGLNISEAVLKLEEINKSEEIKEIITFIKTSERGIAK